MNKCYKCESTSVIQDGRSWVCADHITPCLCSSDHNRTEKVGGNFHTGNPCQEKTKLEAMYYHVRDNKHIRFLESNLLYAGLRTVNTFKAGKLIIDSHTLDKPSLKGRQGRSFTIDKDEIGE